nr:MAG TPA: hypothetical protein [Caudoviricetes sp.]
MIFGADFFTKSCGFSGYHFNALPQQSKQQEHGKIAAGVWRLVFVKWCV